jgi:hypothetical protein
MSISRWIILRMINVSNKICTGNQNTHFMFSNFFPENRAVCEIMSKNTLQPEKPQTIWRMRVACWISEATRSQAHARALHSHPRTRTHRHVLNRARTHKKYVILIAFPIQQLRRECALMLRYTYISSLDLVCFLLVLSLWHFIKFESFFSLM